ncbi:MAG TPA: prohibitin family protein [Nitrospiria bacterium]|jgi:regulator of protease activity HflC (stomatin/prohibitin superfamily)
MKDTYDLTKIPFLDKGPKLIIGVIVLVFLVATISASFEIVGAGERGVIFSKIGGVKDHILNEGLQFKIPFIEDIITVDVKVQKSQTDATAASKDLQTVSSTIALNYHIDPGQVNTVYQDIGLFFKDRVIDPAVQESVKAVSAQFTAEELITRRSEVSRSIESNLKERLLQFNIITDGFNIIDFSFSREFNSAIEAKQTAEQQALKAKRDLDRIKIEAEQKITQAKAEAESQRMQRETISPTILQLRAIEKWDGRFPQVIGGAMPFIDVGTLAPQK